MTVKIFSAVVAVVLMLAFLLPPIVKLKELSFGVVALIGVGMMLVDLWQSLKGDDA